MRRRPPAVLASARTAAEIVALRVAGLVHPVRKLRAALEHSREQATAYRVSWAEANDVARSATGRLWVVLGDSAAQGVGAVSHDRGYVGQLLRALETRDGGGTWRVLNLSVSGARTADVVRDQLPQLDSLDAAPDLVTCAIGGNDLLRTPLPQFVRSFRELLARLPPGAVVATLPRGLAERRAQHVNAVLRGEAPARGLVLADLWATTGPPYRGKVAGDLFHPNEHGYADWARAFATALAVPLDAAPGSRDG